MRGDGPWRNLAKTAAFLAALLTGSAVRVLAARSCPRAPSVEIENPLASTASAAGLICGRPSAAGPSPAVVLLHSCNGDWQQLDERWGKRIASWGYVTLTVDSLRSARPQKHLRRAALRGDQASDAYRALEFLVRDAIRRSRPCCGARVFARRPARSIRSNTASWNRIAKTKFRAAIAFYPPLPWLQGRA